VYVYAVFLTIMESLMTKKKMARVAMAVLGFAVALPVAMTIAAETASASNYAVAWSLEGDLDCIEKVNGDCPESN
jgi:hypothetical protein